MSYPSIEIPITTFKTVLKFDHDSDGFVQGGTHAFTLDERCHNKNGVGKILRINEPVALSWSGDFIEHPDSEAMDATKLNFITVVYFENWDNTGTAKAIYKNTLFDAV